MLVVLAPVAGTVRALADLPDAVFADGLLGPGVAIDPDPGPGPDHPRPGPSAAVHAPVTGEVVAVRAHAFVARGSAGDVLVHLGLDSVDLGAAPFDLALAVGDRLVAGESVGGWLPTAVAATGRSAACAVVALQADPGAVRVVAAPGARVAAGDPVLEWLSGAAAAG